SRKMIFRLVLLYYKIVKRLQFAVHVDSIQLFKSLCQSGNECFLTFTQPNTWVVVFFVRNICSIRIADLTLQVTVILLFVATYTIPKCPLHIGIDIHLNGTVGKRFANLFG